MLVEVEGNGRKRQNKDAYTLHKPVRLNFRRRMTFTIGIDNLWQADLADLSKLSKYKP